MTRALRIAVSFVVASALVGAFAVFAIGRWFERPTYDPVSSFRVEPADPELAAAARARARGETPDDERSATAPPPPPTGRGFVQLRFDVLPDGRPANVEVLGATPPGRYEDQARAAIEARRFIPTYENGEPVTSTRTEIIDFGLSSD